MTDDRGRLLAGRYRLAELLGQGGMGTVWRAHDEQLDREVALKELRLPDDLDASLRKAWIGRLDREARAAARLKHPGVITVHDRIAGEDGRPWIVMELVNGGSLDDLIKEDGPLPPAEVAKIGRQVLDALRAVHATGVTHRDIKPANVLLEGDRVVLTDFGIAAVEGEPGLTRSGALMGTPAYMSPEQVRGLPATAESDLWSVGATLFTAVEGHPPFSGSGSWAVFVAIATEEPATAVRAGELAPVLTGLLRKDPAQRLTAEEAYDLLAGPAGEAEPSRPGPAPTSASTLRLGTAPGAAGPGAERLTPPGHGPVGPARRRGYVLGGLTAGVVAALIAMPWWLPQYGSPDDDAGRIRATDSTPPAHHSSSPSPSPSPVPPTTAASTPTPSPTPTPTPTPTPKPSHTPLDRQAIERVFTLYMNGLTNHDMTSLRRGTCPRLRSTLLGFALNGYFVDRWELQPYEVFPNMDELSVEAKITRRDPETGKLAGDVLNQWIIERAADQQYYVCGWLNQE
ncbi:serine/threonine-protein kinase [Streptomyces sp. RerS4]|uniref:serine/threonine-protein kinase n=1 Tax=Streptomyces sp. RerS4 TaxID=2942449 RepID=UPI00201C0915|nr:serine/threonine-protein kinase [Streptomyces sp. RerS4]UQX04566.1 serine/threonine protein kinase [Streptomyces sp. RerS4]